MPGKVVHQARNACGCVPAARASVPRAPASESPLGRRVGRRRAGRQRPLLVRRKPKRPARRPKIVSAAGGTRNVARTGSRRGIDGETRTGSPGTQRTGNADAQCTARNGARVHAAHASAPRRNAHPGHHDASRFESILVALTMCRLMAISFAEKPSARPTSCGRCSVGMVMSPS